MNTLMGILYLGFFIKRLKILPYFSFVFGYWFWICIALLLLLLLLLLLYQCIELDHGWIINWIHRLMGLDVDYWMHCIFMFLSVLWVWYMYVRCFDWLKKYCIVYIINGLFFLFFWKSFNLWCLLLMIALYHQTKH